MSEPTRPTDHLTGATRRLARAEDESGTYSDVLENLAKSYATLAVQISRISQTDLTFRQRFVLIHELAETSRRARVAAEKMAHDLGMDLTTSMSL